MAEPVRIAHDQGFPPFAEAGINCYGVEGCDDATSDNSVNPEYIPEWFLVVQ